MEKRASVYKRYLNERDNKILEFRKQGKSLKELSSKFDLSVRQISRILKNMSKNVY